MSSKFAVIRGLAAAWAASYAGLVYAFAALQPFSADARTYDYESLFWAAAASLMGGVARTILSLAGDKVIVLFVWRTLLRDCIFALVTGGVVYIIVQAIASVWPAFMTREIRMLLIFGAGYSKGAWQDAVARLARSAADRAQGVVSGSQPPPAPPASVTAPLSDK